MAVLYIFICCAVYTCIPVQDPISVCTPLKVVCVLLLCECALFVDSMLILHIRNNSSMGGSAVRVIYHEGCGREGSTAQGESKCCIYIHVCVLVSGLTLSVRLLAQHDPTMLELYWLTVQGA